MTFVAHGLLGAGLMSLFTMRARKSVKLIVMSVSFIVGTLPDTVDFIAAHLFGAERWVLYTRMHVGDLLAYFIWYPAYFFHLFIDYFIHFYPGFDWWEVPFFRELEVNCWLLGILLCTLTWITRKEDPHACLRFWKIQR